MYGTIDRFEEEFAVIELEDRKVINILRDKIPNNAKEGDVLKIQENVIEIDYKETEKRRKEIEKLVEDLFQ